MSAGSSRSRAAKSPSSKKPERAFLTDGRRIIGMTDNNPFSMPSRNARRNAESS
jgi:hypothetical protein